MKETVIVTGAAGFIGKYVTLELINQGYKVLAISRNKESVDQIQRFLLARSISVEKLSFIVSDLESLTIDLFGSESYSSWIHLGWGGVNREQINDAIVHEKSYMDSVHCLQLAHVLRCQCFCDIGSRAEIDREQGKIMEDEVGTGLSQYGLYKSKFHTYAKDFCFQEQMKYLHIRLFSVIGVGDHPWSVVMTACSKFRKHQSMKFGGCGQVWNFIDVRDVAYRIVKLCKKSCQCDAIILNESGTIHVASSQSIPLKEYIRKIYELCGSHAEITFGSQNGYDSYPDTTTFDSLFPNEEANSFEDTIKWILNNMDI